MYSEDFAAYNQHLKKRRITGFVYQTFYLYPRLRGQLKGLAVDIGCGLGAFARTRPNTHACDINPVNVDELKSQGVPAGLIVDDKLPYENSKFDSVLLDNVIEHIEQPDKILREINRILKLNGYLVVGVPGELGFKSEVDHKIFYGEAELQAALEPFGFKRKNHFYAPFKSDYFDKNLRQYCLYMRFEKISSV